MARRGKTAGRQNTPSHGGALPCPRCSSADTKYCWKDRMKPIHYCNRCQRHWVVGGRRLLDRAALPRRASSPPLPPPLSDDNDFWVEEITKRPDDQDHYRRFLTPLGIQVQTSPGHRAANVLPFPQSPTTADGIVAPETDHARSPATTPMDDTPTTSYGDGSTANMVSGDNEIVPPATDRSRSPAPAPVNKKAYTTSRGYGSTGGVVPGDEVSRGCPGSQPVDFGELMGKVEARLEEEGGFDKVLEFWNWFSSLLVFSMWLVPGGCDGSEQGACADGASECGFGFADTSLLRPEESAAFIRAVLGE